jgi:hypothetical protein
MRFAIRTRHLMLLPLLLGAAVLLSSCAGLRSSRPGGGRDRPTCPLCGLPTTSERLLHRPLAVMIENHHRAQPQSGLDRACIVYEAPVEGGISRFMALYLHEDAPKLGPIRSARPYFIAWALEYHAAYIHCGQSIGAAILLKNLQVPHLDEMQHPQPFHRDHARRAPHNLYSSTTDLRSAVKAEGWDYSAVPPRAFADKVSATGAGATGTPATGVEVRFPGDYWLSYTYDPTRGRYRRFMEGKPHRDAQSGRQLTARTVILQYVETRPSEEGKGILDLWILGSGQADVCGGGQRIAARWTKTSVERGTAFTDVAGRPLALPPGPVWIIAVPTTSRVEWSGTTPPRQPDGRRAEP